MSSINKIQITVPENILYKLEVKFVLIACIVIILVSTVANYLILNATSERIFSEAQRRAELVTEATAIAFTNTLIYQELGLVEEGGLMDNYISGLMQNRQTELTEVVVIDPQGIVLASSNYKWYKKNINDPVLRRAIHTKNMLFLPDSLSNSTHNILAIAPLQISSKRFGTLIMSFIFHEEFTYLASFKTRMLTLTVVGMLIALLVTIIIAKTLASPIKRLANEMVNISEENLTSALEPSRKDEIGQLEQGFIAMIKRLRNAAIEKEKTHAAFIQSEKLAALGTMVAGLAHEINNPIAGLYNCLHRISAEPENTIQILKYTNLMQKALDHIQKIVSNLLNYSRNKTESFNQIDLQKIIADSLELLNYQLKKNNITLSRKMQNNLPEISGDANALEQVFINIILNAIDAMPGGGTLHIGARKNGGDITIAITDTGCGIAESDLSKIYDPFFTTKEVGKGTGLGLSIVKRTVADHHATLEVKSTPGKGSTFLLGFPIANQSAKNPRQKTSIAILAGGKSTRMGTDKALVKLNGKTLIEHVLAVAREISQDVVIIANSAAKFKFLNVPVYPDSITGIGPLAGIHAALTHIESDQCLILACDLPFLSADLLRFLSENGKNSDAFAIRSQNGLEPLCAVYSKTCLPVIERQIEQKQLSVAALFKKVNSRIVNFHTGHSLYADHIFDNINTENELSVAKAVNIK